MHYVESELKELSRIVKFHNEVLNENEFNKVNDHKLILRLLYDKLHYRKWDRRCPSCSSTCTHHPTEGYWNCPDTFGECLVSKIFVDHFGRIWKTIRFTS